MAVDGHGILEFLEFLASVKMSILTIASPKIGHHFLGGGKCQGFMMFHICFMYVSCIYSPKFHPFLFWILWGPASTGGVQGLQMSQRRCFTSRTARALIPTKLETRHLRTAKLCTTTSHQRNPGPHQKWTGSRYFKREVAKHMPNIRHWQPWQRHWICSAIFTPSRRAWRRVPCASFC